MTWLAFLAALTCADGSCDQVDWGTLPAPSEAVDADECPNTDPGCADLAWGSAEALESRGEGCDQW